MQKPLILDFKQYPETPESTIYHYDNETQMNVVNVDGKKVPFIELGNTVVELETKSFVKDEQDEEKLSSEMDLGKPSQHGVYNQNLLLELETKTKVKDESDDFHNPLAELETKTRVKNEGDDQRDPYYN